MKIKLSRANWEDVGRRAGWIKIAKEGDTEKIDGKWYVETKDSMMEIPDPTRTPEKPQVPKSTEKYTYAPAKSVSVDILGQIYTFEEGKTYSDAAGNYKVNKITDDKKLDVTYLDGTFSGKNTIYDAKDRAKIIHRHQKTKDDKNRMKTLTFKNKNEYFTLGFLAKNCRIRAGAAPTKHAWFEALYKKLTGEDALAYLGKGYAQNENENMWGTELRLVFPRPSNEVLNKMSFPSDIEFVSSGKNGMEVNDNNYILTLFGMGFTLGPNERNIEKITTHIPDSDKEYFYQGINLS